MMRTTPSRRTIRQDSQSFFTEGRTFIGAKRGGRKFCPAHTQPVLGRGRAWRQDKNAASRLKKAPKREATRSIPPCLGKCRNEDFLDFSAGGSVRWLILFERPVAAFILPSMVKDSEGKSILPLTVRESRRLVRLISGPALRGRTPKKPGKNRFCQCENESARR
jgi:hypothetical protein